MELDSETLIQSRVSDVLARTQAHVDIYNTQRNVPAKIQVGTPRLRYCIVGPVDPELRAHSCLQNAPQRLHPRNPGPRGNRCNPGTPFRAVSSGQDEPLRYRGRELSLHHTSCHGDPECPHTSAAEIPRRGGYALASRARPPPPQTHDVVRGNGAEPDKYRLLPLASTRAASSPTRLFPYTTRPSVVLHGFELRRSGVKDGRSTRCAYGSRPLSTSTSRNSFLDRMPYRPERFRCPLTMPPLLRLTALSCDSTPGLGLDWGSTSIGSETGTVDSLPLSRNAPTDT
uniref:Uncharacterized protein n=1 Tax=Mycena chlorophos TaxID=658473 RepID=A0ABQ0KVX7_MYCCL|nr:predicted protein [Mycena chlorophos]